MTIREVLKLEGEIPDERPLTRAEFNERLRVMQQSLNLIASCLARLDSDINAMRDEGYTFVALKGLRE